MAIEDCYFFMSGQCNKGPKCPFRHSAGAKATLDMCEEYKMDGVCSKPDCGKRHSRFHLGTKSLAESRPVFSQEHCYFERVKGACAKDACAFTHFKKPAVVIIPSGASAGVVDFVSEVTLEAQLQQDCESLKTRLGRLQSSFDDRMATVMQGLEADSVY